jgi:hypothetical protein
MSQELKTTKTKELSLGGILTRNSGSTWKVEVPKGTFPECKHGKSINEMCYPCAREAEMRSGYRGESYYD